MEKYELLKMGKEWPCFMTKSKKKVNYQAYHSKATTNVQR